MGLHRPLAEEERRLDFLAGRTLLATATPDDAERQQRPSTAERIADRLMFGDRLSEQRQGRLDVAAGGGDEAPAASRLGHYPVAAEPRRIGLPDLEDSCRVVDSPKLEQRLDVVRRPRAEVRVAPPERRGLPVRLAQPLESRRRVTAPERDEPRHRQLDGGLESELLTPASSGARRLVTRELEFATVDGDPHDRGVV